MLLTKDIAWLAGLIEGEGCVTVNRQGRSTTPVLQLDLTDLDVMVRAATLLKRKVHLGPVPGPRHKQSYRVRVTGCHGASWLMLLYPLLGRRRRNRIREVLVLWRKTRRRQPCTFAQGWL